MQGRVRPTAWRQPLRSSAGEPPFGEQLAQSALAAVPVSCTRCIRLCSSPVLHARPDSAHFPAWPRHLCRLEEAASALRGSAAAGEDCSIAGLGRQLAALSDRTAELYAALAALGGSAADPPAALGLLQAQVQQLQSELSSLPLPPAPPTLPLQGLALHAEAAAASVRPRLAAGGSMQQAARPAWAPLQPGEQQALRGWYLPAFADCFAAEVEALQESEPPIPAGVLLQCVRLAADSTALFPPHLARLVLAGSGSGSP